MRKSDQIASNHFTDKVFSLENLEPRLLLSGTIYTVDSLDDIVAQDGQITLREAIIAANSNTAIYDAPAGSSTEVDSIDFLPALFSDGANPAQGHITLNGVALSVSDNLEIIGPGRDLLTIDADLQSSVIKILGTSTQASISGMTLTNGMQENLYTRQADGAGLRNEGTATLTDIAITNNSIVMANGAYGEALGGGIYNAGTLTLTNAVLSGNYAKSAGGAIFNRGKLTISNAVITANASSGTGGGIYSQEYITINSSTIAYNHDAHSDASDGLQLNISASINNSIIVANSFDISGFDHVSNVIHGYNNLYNIDPAFVRNPSPGADGLWFTDDDDLGDLHLKSTSIAIDAGDLSDNDDNYGQIPFDFDLDQEIRVYGEAIDIGAYEYQGDISPLRESASTEVTTLEDLCDSTDNLTSIREAIFHSRKDGLDAPVSFSQSISGGTINLKGVIDIQESVSIDASANEAITLKGNGQSSVIKVTSHSVQTELTNIIITGGDAVWGEGGGIYNRGIMTLHNVSVIRNSARNGGGIYNTSTLTIYDSLIAGNVSEPDSGISNSSGGGIYSSYRLNIFNCAIIGNIAKGATDSFEDPTTEGGGIFAGSLKMVNSTVAFNTAETGQWGFGDSRGGGIYSTNQIIENSIVSFNYGQEPYENLAYEITGGNNLIGIDPLFIQNPSAGNDGVWATEDDFYGDLRLRPDSPAIDAGDNSKTTNLWPEPLTNNIDGSERLVGGTVDIGAQEYQGLTGDINGDETVNIMDFLVLKSNYGTPTLIGAAAGDIDGDGDVDIFDFLALKANYGSSL